MQEAFRIRAIAQGDPLWAPTAAFAHACSWRAGPVLAGRMRRGEFLPWERVIVAERQGSIAGYCTLCATDELPGDCGLTPFIGFVFVDESARGHRLSQQMLACAAEYAASLGFRRVYVTSGEVGLYEKFGFTKIGEVQSIHGATEQLFVRDL